MQNETSAFANDEEMKEDEQTAEADELSKLRAEVTAQRSELAQKYTFLSIDNQAAKDYFQKLKTVINSENEFWGAIETMSDVILHEFEISNYDPMTQVMCVRGLMLLMLNDQFADYIG